MNRVTLSAFGTTGVLLAASLTMLAMVSALVTFNAWPTRGGAVAANEVSIHQAPAAPVVRAVRRSAASVAAAAARARATAGAAGSGLSGGSGGGAGGPGSAGGGPGGPGGGGGPGSVPSGPSPQVPHFPPGEGDPGVVPQPQPAPSSPTTIVHTTVCGAVSGVAAGAAGC